MKTTYFGEFVDNNTKYTQPLEELTGCIKVHELNGVKAAFIYCALPDKKGYVRYDMPIWAEKYNNLVVAVLARKIVKEVNGKQYNKLIVVACRALRTTRAFEENNHA